MRFTSIKINDGQEFIDPEKDTVIDFEAIVLKDLSEICFSFLLRGPDNSEPITSTGLMELVNEPVTVGKKLKFSYIIPSNTFRTGLFPAYFWLGKKTDINGTNYHYDVVDSIYYLNYSSDKSSSELGYNSANPVGYFNINRELRDIKIV